MTKKYTIKYSSAFKTAIKKFKHNEKTLNNIAIIINRLANNEILEEQYHDHDLIGNYKGFRECHIQPDLCLIYKKNNDTLILYCSEIGSHGELFKK